MEDPSQKVTEEQLLEDFVRTGREEPFDVLVQRHKLALFNLAYRVLYDRHAAEDIVQRAFIRLLERKNDLRYVEALQWWLYKTALNLALDMKKTMRRRKGRERLAAPSEIPQTPREAAASEELRGELDSALARLKDSLRVPLVLRFLQGLSYGEAGKVMDLSAEAVRKRVNRGLRALRKLLVGRGLLVPLVAIEAGLKSIPAEAASASFLTSASSIIKAVSAGGIAAKVAATSTSAIKGGLLVTAKSKIAIGVGAAILLAGTITFIATRHPERRDAAPATGRSAKAPVESRIRPPEEKKIGRTGPGEDPTSAQIPPQKEGLWGQVVDVEGKGIPDARVEAGVFEGDSLSSLIRKVLVRNTITNSVGEFWFPEKSAFSGAVRILARRRALPQKSPEALHGLLIASKKGYCAARQEIDFESVSGDQKIVLREAPEISGRVIWKESREPISKVKIVCAPEERDLYQSSKEEVQSDQAGDFSLTISAEGAAKLWAEFVNAFDPEPREPNIVLVPGEKTRDFVLAVDLLSDTILEGRVLDENGGPVAGAEVRLSNDASGQSIATRSHEDGQYRLMVRRDWPYQGYFVKDWPERPKRQGWRIGPLGMCAKPAEECKRILPDGKWDWAQYWTPPPNVPPERLVAFHPDYEIGVAEIPLLGLAQLRRGVDIILHKGSLVSGRVVDNNSNELAGAVISIWAKREDGNVLIAGDLRDYFGDRGGFRSSPKRVTAGDDGSFQIHYLREGKYELAADHKDCSERVTRELLLQPHQVVHDFDFVLLRDTGFIRGKVLDENGDPWPHAKVKASGVPISYSPDTSGVKEDGSYEIANMKPGKYDLWLNVAADYAESDGILHATSLKDVPTGTEDANLTVTVLPAGSLRVRVLDETRQPIQKFHLECYPLSLTYGRGGIVRGGLRVAESEGKHTYDSYTRDAKHSGILHLKREIVSESGEFVAESVAPGSYVVCVKADKRGEEFEEVKIEADEEAEVTLELKGLGRLEGIVLDGRRQPLEGILVRAMKMKDVLNSTERITIMTYIVADWEELYARSKTKSGPDGRFVLENLEQTEYRITAVDGQGHSVFADVSVGESGQESVELVLNYGSGSIAGYVYGEDGSPASRVDVLLEGSGQKSRTRTDEQGYYAFWDLLPGRYLVKAQMSGKRTPLARGGGISRHYRGQEVDLAEGEQASVDFLVSGQGEIEGTISLAGDAARADAWFKAGFQPLLDGDRRLILKEITDSGLAGRTELHLPVDETFELKDIPAGTYEAWAHYVFRVSPEPVFDRIGSSYLRERPCLVKFVSEPEIVRVASGSRAAIHLTISQACAPHYPVPDPATCDKWVGTER